MTDSPSIATLTGVQRSNAVRRSSPQLSTMSESEIDQLDNLVTARDKLELYNMLALRKDISIDWSSPRDSVLGRIYPARWLSVPVDVACLEIDTEHLNTRPHALGSLVNTALTLRKAMGRINQRYYCGVMATGTGQGSPKAQSRAQSGKHNPQTAPPDDTSSSKLDNTSRLSGQCRAHIQELSAIQLEPQLCVITSTLPLQTVSLHQLILDGKGRWSWPERIQMLIQVSQGMAALHAEGIVHGNLRLSNIYLNPATKRTVISSTAWDQLLPYDVLNVHQADNPGSLRWTAPECYEYITTQDGRLNSRPPSQAAPTSNANAQNPRSQRRPRPHPPSHRHACDVYAFAITFWELANSTGELPYSNLKSPREVVSYVASNKRMFLPPKWPADVRELISLCWSGDYTRRPSFSVITEALSCIMLQPNPAESPE